MNYEVEHPELGNIYYIRNKRAKRIIISVKPKYVRVVIPRRQSFKNAQKFLNSKIKWIKNQIKKMEKEVFKANSLPKIERKIAKNLLSKRLAKLASKNNFEYNRVSIRNQKTRWGSCSSKNNINLNKKLLHLPSELIDYILLHELVHTRVKNHSKDFWNELETVVPNARTIDKQLREYQYCLFSV